MSAPTKRPSREVLAQWIECINEEGRGITAWELGFMANVTEQFERGGMLSDGQVETLERIYVNRTS